MDAVVDNTGFNVKPVWVYILPKMTKCASFKVQAMRANEEIANFCKCYVRKSLQEEVIELRLWLEALE